MHPLVVTFLNGIDYSKEDSILQILPLDMFEIIIEELVSICCVPDYKNIYAECIPLDTDTYINGVCANKMYTFVSTSSPANAILVLDRKGKLIKKIIHFSNITGITISLDNTIFVSDRGYKEIISFNIDNMSIDYESLDKEHSIDSFKEYIIPLSCITNRKRLLLNNIIYPEVDIGQISVTRDNTSIALCVRLHTKGAVLLFPTKDWPDAHELTESTIDTNESMIHEAIPIAENGESITYQSRMGNSVINYVEVEGWKEKYRNEFIPICATFNPVNNNLVISTERDKRLFIVNTAGQLLYHLNLVHYLVRRINPIEPVGQVEWDLSTPIRPIISVAVDRNGDMLLTDGGGTLLIDKDGHVEGRISLFPGTFCALGVTAIDHSDGTIIRAEVNGVLRLIENC